MQETVISVAQLKQSARDKQRKGIAGKQLEEDAVMDKGRSSLGNSSRSMG